MTFVWDTDPELLNVSGLFSIRYYSLLFALGLFLGYALVRDFWFKEQLRKELLDNLAIYIFLATIIGARLGHCLFYEPSYYLTHPLEIILPFKLMNGEIQFTGFQGLASHGGILAVFLSIYLFSKKYRARFYSILDKVAVGGSLTAVFIRLGNFMNSEILGIPTNSNYGVVFLRYDNVARHPAQLYEAVAYLIIFIGLFILYKSKKRNTPGLIFGIFFTTLFISRFIIEYFKIDQVRFEEGMVLNMGQILSIPFIILGCVVTIWVIRRQKIQLQSQPIVDL